jgi:hypothetical protein
MQFQRIRVWQWCVIGAIFGGLAGVVLTLDRTGQSDIPTRDRRELINNLGQKAPDGRLVFDNIVIDPVVLDPTGRAVQRVYYTQLMENRQTKSIDPIPWLADMSVPVVANPPSPDYRIADLLTARAKDNADIRFSYAWWKVSNVPGDRELWFWQTPTMAMAMSVLLGVLLVGGLWPLVIRALVRAGFGYPEEPEAASDLAAVRVQTAAAPEKAVVSAAETQKLADLNAQLEQNTAGMAVQAKKVDDAAEQKKVDAVIRKLEGQRLESQETVAASEESKDFKGQYYPVARPAAKKE